MDARIHEVLDGGRAPEDLTPGERAHLADYREVIDLELEALRQEPVPDLAPSVLSRIAEMEDHGSPVEAAGTEPARRNALSRVLGWLLRPRPVQFSLRPAHGLVAAAAVGAVLFALPEGPADTPGASSSALTGSSPATGLPSPAARSHASEADPAPHRVLVHFHLDAPGATSVRLAGDFTDWQPSYEMRQVTPGVWSLVVPLEPGVHDYGFVVDEGQWRTDPQAPSVADGFGGRNSRLALLAPQERS